MTEQTTTGLHVCICTLQARRRGGGGGGGFEGVCLNTPFGPQKVFLTGNKNALNFANMARAIAWHLQGS